MARYPDLTEMDELASSHSEAKEFETDSDSDSEELSEEEDGQEGDVGAPCFDEYGRLISSASPRRAGAPEASATSSTSEVTETKYTQKLQQSTESTPQKVEWVTVKRDENGRMGLSLRRAGPMLYISYVKRHSPAAKAGLGFGDRILGIQGFDSLKGSGRHVMELIASMNAKDFSFKILRRPYDLSVKALVTPNQELSLVAKCGKELGTIKLTKLARTGVIKGFHLIAVKDECVIGWSEAELLKKLSENDTSPRMVRLMPQAFYKCLMKHQDKDRVKQNMQLSQLT